MHLVLLLVVSNLNFSFFASRSFYPKKYLNPDLNPDLNLELIEVNSNQDISNFENRPYPSIWKKDQFKKIDLFPKFNAVTTFTNINNDSSESLNNISNNRFRRSLSEVSVFDANIESVLGDDQNRNWDFYRSIYEAISSGFLIDTLLAQYNHFGEVRVQFLVDQNGRLAPESLRFISEDKILQVYVARILQKTLKNGISKQFQAKTNEKEFQILARFRFLSGTSALNANKQRSFGRAVFVFDRYTEERPIINGTVQDNLASADPRLKVFNLKNRETDPHLTKINSDMESSSSLKEDQFMGVGLTLNIEELIDRYKKKQKIQALAINRI